jgi:hypothetical protein
MHVVTSLASLQKLIFDLCKWRQVTELSGRLQIPQATAVTKVTIATSGFTAQSLGCAKNSGMPSCTATVTVVRI